MAGYRDAPISIHYPRASNGTRRTSYREVVRGAILRLVTAEPGQGGFPLGLRLMRRHKGDLMVEYRDALYKHSLTKSVHDARRKIHREVAEGMRHPAASNRRADPLGRGAVETILVPSALYITRPLWPCGVKQSVFLF